MRIYFSCILRSNMPGNIDLDFCRITASGTGTFQKGYLGGRTATLEVTGTITAR